MKRTLIAALGVIAAATTAPTVASADEISISTTVAFESRYIFRRAYNSPKQVSSLE